MAEKNSGPPKNGGNPAPKSEKGKKERRGIHSLYKIEDDKIERLRPTCERCGPGYFMASHNDRYTCGHCGFARYKQSGT